MSKRTAQKRRRKRWPHFEKCVTDGNEKPDELAKAGAMLDEGFMAQASAKTVQQEREEVCAALQYAALFSLSGQKKSGLLWTRRERKQGIGRNGVLLPASTDV